MPYCKDKSTKVGGQYVWIYTGNKSAKFHGNIPSPSENIAKSFRGGGLLFESHCIWLWFKTADW